MESWLQYLIVFLGVVGSIDAIVKAIIILSHNVVRLTTVIERLLDSDKKQDRSISAHDDMLNANEKELDRLELEVKYIKERT